MFIRFCRRTARLRLSAALLATLVLHPLPAWSASTGNLLRNGDAESHRCTDDWTAQTPVPGWTVLRGAASVLCYSAFDHARELPVLPQAGQGGQALFAAPGSDTAISQTVDLAPARQGIDRGAVRFRLSGWLGGWRDRPEQARLTALFRDGEGRALGSPVLLGDAGPQARGGRTALLSLERRGTVPIGARTAELTLNFESGFTSYHNAYADQLGFELEGEVPVLHAGDPGAPAAQVPALDHVFVLMMENTNYADVIHGTGGRAQVDSHMPYLASLRRQGVLLSNYWASYHPSDQNYVAMISGDTFRYGSVYYPDYDLPVDHLGDRLEASGKRWMAYVQNMNTPCNLAVDPSPGWFAPDDEPFAQFDDVISNPPRCQDHLRDLADLGAAAARGDLPDFAWIAADGWWDGEGAWMDNTDVAASLSAQDQFLQTTLQPLLSSPAWRQSRALLVLTWDESLGWGWPDNHVATLLIGSPGLLREGTVDPTHYDGYSVLRTAEAALRVPGLGRFDRFATPINAVFAKNPPSAASAGALLVPAPSLATRGHQTDVFGQVATPAAATAAQAIVYEVDAAVPAGAVVRVAQAGQLPDPDAPAWPAPAGGRLVIPGEKLDPGRYALWLQDADGAPLQAEQPLQVLDPHALPTADAPGIAVLGAAAGDGLLPIREASNLVVHYCRPAGSTPDAFWIGVFPDGTPPDQWTQANADAIGYWLRAPGTRGTSPCGEQAAFVSELTPEQPYQIQLFQLQADGSSAQIGRAARIVLEHALP